MRRTYAVLLFKVCNIIKDKLRREEFSLSRQSPSSPTKRRAAPHQSLAFSGFVAIA
jgi:hypothetical protein